MRAFMIMEYNKLEVIDAPIPVPQDDEVLIRIHTAGICHSDLHLANGDWSEIYPIPLPFPLGHEGIGTVTELGPKAGKLIQKGDRVIFGLGGAAGADWCGACEYCLAGRTMFCVNQAALFGTFADYVAAKEKVLVKLPDSVPDTAAPLACAGLTAYGAMKKLSRFGLTPGYKVAIVGAAGGLGHYAIQLAKAFGFKVVGIDLNVAEKMDFIKKTGADYAVDIDNAEKFVKEELDGVHACIVFSPKTEGFHLGYKLLRSCGVLMGVCLPSQTEPPMSISQFATVFNGITYCTSLVGNVQEMRELIVLAAAGKVKSEPSGIVGINDIADIFEKMEARKVTGRYIVDLLNK